MVKALMILGNQLFPPKFFETSGVTHVFMAETIELINENYAHKQKIFTFLSSMRHYAASLERLGIQVSYQRLNQHKSDYVSLLEKFLNKLNITKVQCFEVEDQGFERLLIRWAEKTRIQIEFIQSPMFLVSRQDFHSYLKNVKKPFMKTFYESQRKNLNILMDEKAKPWGGKFSFDAANRKKLPRDYLPPRSWKKIEDSIDKEVKYLVTHTFKAAKGELEDTYWPTTRQEALDCLDVFIESRLAGFGDYQDSISNAYEFLNHSLISSSLNIGLITPDEVCTKILAKTRPSDENINSLEGFIRQLIGWREFVRGIYRNYENTLYQSNHWNHQRPLSQAFFEAKTNIPPVDDAIKKAIRTGYNHHIERLMILANFMNLCEIRPIEVYRWFMSMYVDSSDWVMAANVFGMGLMSDGGIFATKPYISGSNYIIKMSDYKKAEWAEIWDALYWRFIEKHQHQFKSNPRMSMMVKQLEKQTQEKRKYQNELAEAYLQKIVPM